MIAQMSHYSQNGQQTDAAGTTYPTDAAVHLRGLAKALGSVQAVSDLSLTIRPGETVALLGPNGTSKTPISMLLGLIAPDRGTASLLGMAPEAAMISPQWLLRRGPTWRCSTSRCPEPVDLKPPRCASKCLPVA